MRNIKYIAMIAGTLGVLYAIPASAEDLSADEFSLDKNSVIGSMDTSMDAGSLGSINIEDMDTGNSLDGATNKNMSDMKLSSDNSGSIDIDKDFSIDDEMDDKTLSGSLNGSTDIFESENDSSGSEKKWDDSSSDAFMQKFQSIKESMSGKDSVPTLETESLDSMRSEMTESMKKNASSTLKELMGDSFSGLDSSLFQISDMPEINLESLNVQYADMRKAFEDASGSLTGESLSGSLDMGSLSLSTGENFDISSLDEKFENLKNSEQFRTVKEQLSLSKTIYSQLESSIPGEKKLGDYSGTISSQNQQAKNNYAKIKNDAQKVQESKNKSDISDMKKTAKENQKNSSKNKKK